MATLPKVDVLIVGSGAAAGPLMVELLRAGRRVVVLERGENRRTETDYVKGLDTLKYVTRGELSPSSDDLPVSFRPSAAEPARAVDYIMSNTVGGSSVTWVGQAFRFLADDFKVKSTVRALYGKSGALDYLAADGAALADWPFRYEDLEPYYDKAERSVGVGGWPGNLNGKIRPANPDEGNPYEAPRKNDYPYRPLRDNAMAVAFRAGCLKLGYKPFHSPTAITTIPYTNPDGVDRSACTYCAFCAGHGCWNGSKSSTLVSLLPVAERSERFELRPRCDVTRIHVAKGRAVAAEYFDENGEVQLQPAELIVLAAYPLQNVRILLASGVTGRGFVGKYYMTRSVPWVTALFSDRLLNGFNGPSVQRQGIDEFNGEIFSEEKLRLPKDQFFIRGGYICSATQSTPLGSFNVVPPGHPTWGPAYKEYLKKNFNRLMSTRLLGEPLPYEDSTLDLDPALKDARGRPALRVTRRPKTNELRMGRFHFRKTEEIYRAAGASQTWGSDHVMSSAMMTHDTGGCRMSDDPASSATNRYGQLWEVPNLMVAGGALFPTMSGHNPTMTIFALSYLQADAIVNGRLSPSDSHKHG